MIIKTDFTFLMKESKKTKIPTDKDRMQISFARLINSRKNSVLKASWAAPYTGPDSK
jgi:hypothetical protein